MSIISLVFYDFNSNWYKLTSYPRTFIYNFLENLTLVGDCWIPSDMVVKTAETLRNAEAVRTGRFLLPFELEELEELDKGEKVRFSALPALRADR